MSEEVLFLRRLFWTLIPLLFIKYKEVWGMDLSWGCTKLAINLFIEYILCLFQKEINKTVMITILKEFMLYCDSRQKKSKEKTM